MDGASQYLSLLRVVIALLCVGAFVLLVIVLTGDRTDLTPAQVMATAAALAVLSLAAAAGLDLARVRPDIAAIGYLTAIAAAAALIAVLDAIWSDDLLYDGSRRALGYTLLLALGGGQISLLLRRARPGDSDAVRLVLAATLIAVASLVGMGIAEIYSPGPDISVKPVAATAVVYILGMTLLPLLRLSAGATAD